MNKVAQPAVSTEPGSTAPELSEYERLELTGAAGEGEQVFLVRVGFDESNPMNTVGGIQVYAKLKDGGQILKTVPDFDALYEDKYHTVGRLLSVQQRGS